jgi:thiol:disulfide interchange protein
MRPRLEGDNVKHTVIASCVVLFVLMLTPGHALLAQTPNAIAPRADALMSAALKRAQAERKIVLIEFGASWCVWCRTFETFVHAPEIKQIIADNYVLVNLTVQERDDKKALENAGAQEAMNTWGGAKSGLPFYVFVDATGRKIADSNAMPDGTNIGFPATAQELQAFVGVLDKTAPRLGKVERTKIVDYLSKLIKP